jgi:hypothetical protein
MDGLQSCLIALRIAASSSDPYQRIVVERHIDEYLRAVPFSLGDALERLSKSIQLEERERREGEDWSVARNYVRSLRNMVATSSSDAA